MKPRKFTPSKAKLPDNEKIIGGDAPGNMNPERKINIQKIIKKVKNGRK